MLIPHNLDYSSFVISFEIGKCEFYTFVVLSQDGFVFFLSSLHFGMNFRKSLSISAKMATRILMVIALNQ